MSSSILLNSYKWVMFARLIGRFAGIISTLILVRILSPEDYGIAAQALFVLMLFDALSNTGTEQYVIKQSNLTSDCLFTSWTLNIVLKALTAFLIFVFSPQIASFFNEERLTEVLQVVSMVAIFGSLKSPAIIVLKRDMRFEKISIIEITSKLLTVVLTISLGLWLKSYWALIWANVFSSVLTVLISYKVAPKKIRFTLINLKDQLIFAKGVFLTSLIGYIRAKLDILIISKKFGAASVGSYSLGQEFALLPYTEGIAPLTQPLYSSLAKVKDNSYLLKQQLFKYMSVSYSLVIPSAVGIVLLADKIVLLLFGQQWIEAAPIMAYLSILMLTFVTNGAYKIIFTLKSKFFGIALLDLMGIILITSAFFIEPIASGSDFSIFRSLVGIVILVISICLAKIFLRYEVKLAILAMIIPVISSLLMAIFIFLFLPIVEDVTDLNWLLLLLVIIPSIVIYLLFWSLSIVLLKKKHYIWQFNYDLILQFKNKLFKPLSQ